VCHGPKNHRGGKFIGRITKFDGLGAINHIPGPLLVILL